MRFLNLSVCRFFPLCVLLKLLLFYIQLTFIIWMLRSSYKEALPINNISILHLFCSDKFEPSYFGLVVLWMSTKFCSLFQVRHAIGCIIHAIYLVALCSELVKMYYFLVGSTNAYYWFWLLVLRPTIRLLVYICQTGYWAFS